MDALVGRHTRKHRDRDLAVDLSTWETCLSVCTELGYVVETDWRPEDLHDLAVLAALQIHDDIRTADDWTRRGAR